MIENIPQYIAPEGVDVNQNKFVVDIDDPRSIASVLKYIIDNFDDFVGTLREQIRHGDSFEFGTINENGNYVALKGNQLYEEQKFSDAATSYPELYPLIAELAKLIIKASKKEKTSGPWATSETIFGQFIIPDLASKGEEYMQLLKDFMEANVEIRCSSYFQEYFKFIWEDLCEEWGIDPEEYEDDEEYLGDPDEMYIDVSDSINGNWDELLEELLDVDGISKRSRKLIDGFIEKSNEFSSKYLLFDNGIMFVATNQKGDEVYLNKPYISFNVQVENYGYGNSAGIGEYGKDYIDIDLPYESNEIVSDFLVDNGYEAAEINIADISNANYIEDKNLDLTNIKLPADTDFCDKTIDQKNSDFEIWHNTALISRILTVLLERETWTDTEYMILKQYLADIPNFTDMYLSNVMNTNIIITCNREKTKGVYDYQMISFMLSQGMVGTANSTNGSTMAHVLSPENKETIIKLIEVHKPEWVKNF